jgi:uncharacterized hydrophobic protein (TIGR00341 family)
LWKNKKNPYLPNVLSEKFFFTVKIIFIMPLRIIQISAPDSVHSEIKKVADEKNAVDYWYNAKNRDGRRTTNILVSVENQQELMDELQKKMSNVDNWRLVVVPVEATVPHHETTETTEKKFTGPSVTREALFNQIQKGAKLDSNFVLFTLLASIVCSIGLIKDNAAVVIGAMVIAPLLGPNLGLAFGAALGDKEFIIQAIKTNITGLLLTFTIAIVTGLLIELPTESHELLSRTDVGFDAIALALAAGSAAVLSLTTGLSSSLVGVMVAAALMPPALAVGLFIGAGHIANAYSACLLLAANIVCISLASQLIFLIKGIKPRTWYHQRQSKQSTTVNIITWLFLLLAVMGLIYLNSQS